MIYRIILAGDIVKLRGLLSKGMPYVLPHHHYIYWMMANYYSESNIVAIENDEVVGYLCAVPEENGKCYFIWQIIVEPQMSHKGIAVELMNHLRDLAERKRISALELTIDKNNKRSQEFFQEYAEKYGSGLEEIGEYRYEENYDIVYRIRRR